MTKVNVKKIYLASPLFTPEEKENVRKVARQLRAMNYDVFVPMEHEIEGAWNLSNAAWAQKVFEVDEKGIRDADMIVAIVYGMKDDAGTAWEIGYAKGLGKKVKLYPVNNTTYSLMIGCSVNDVFDVHENVFSADWSKCLLS